MVEESVSVDSPPHIIIDSESMLVDSTKVIVDRIEDPFKDNIIGNIVGYKSSKNEEEKVEEDKFAKKAM